MIDWCCIRFIYYAPLVDFIIIIMHSHVLLANQLNKFRFCLISASACRVKFRKFGLVDSLIECWLIEFKLKTFSLIHSSRNQFKWNQQPNLESKLKDIPSVSLLVWLTAIPIQLREIQKLKTFWRDELISDFSNRNWMELSR